MVERGTYQILINYKTVIATGTKTIVHRFSTGLTSGLDFGIEAVLELKLEGQTNVSQAKCGVRAGE